MTERYGIYDIHAKEGCIPPCPFHAPSDHPLKDAPIHIRDDKMYIVERICEHGVGHDDPDSIAYMQAHGHKWAGVHGCDGCCAELSVTPKQIHEAHDKHCGCNLFESELREIAAEKFIGLYMLGPADEFVPVDDRYSVLADSLVAAILTAIRQHLPERGNMENAPSMIQKATRDQVIDELEANLGLAHPNHGEKEE